MASTGEPAKASYSTDPALYIYTSLTAGSSHIVTATSRLETILRANRVPFKALDLATDEKARMLWGRRAGKDESGRQRKLPALVQMGLVLGDLVEIEEWNEYGELKQHVTIYYDEFTQPSISEAQKLPPVMKKGPAVAAPTAASTATTASKPAVAPAAPPLPPASAASSSAPAVAKTTGSSAAAAAAAALPIRSIAEEAAAKAKKVQLQSLRDKVYGKGNTGPVKKEDADQAGVAPAAKEQGVSAKSEDKKDMVKSPAPLDVPEPSSTTVKTAAGLQSPTSGAWKGSGEDTSSVEALRNLIQSPTSTAWKPTDIDPPVTTHRGSVVSPASAEEIKAVEKELAIKEEPEEDEEEEDDEDEDSEEEEESKEAVKDKKVTEKAEAKTD